MGSALLNFRGTNRRSDDLSGRGAQRTQAQMPIERFVAIVGGIFICGLVIGYVVRDIISRVRRRRMRKRGLVELSEPAVTLVPPSSPVTSDNNHATADQKANGGPQGSNGRREA